jgi:N utilization substance protein A
MEADSADTEPVWALLRKHVPEVASGLVKVLGIVREPGRRSALAVACRDDRVDPVGSVVGHRGERAKRIAGELGGEKIDIIRWDESAERFTANLLAPLRLAGASFDDITREAKVTLAEHTGTHLPDLKLRSELLMKLTGWKLHVEEKHGG